MNGAPIRFLRKTLTRADLVVIVLLSIGTLLSFSLWCTREAGHRVVIVVDGRETGTFSLDSGHTTLQFEGAKGPFSIEINDGRVRMKDSTCPGKCCVEMGWIGCEGQMICCIPNRVILKIIGGTEAYDALAR
ncbi:MAG: NusG domain II-containing protein [bacterium]